jgi:hypothetical protein
VALLALGRLGALAGRRLHHPRLDPELAQAQAVVLVELDDRAGEEVVVVAARVLEQVARELLLERGLVLLHALVVLLAEVDRVLVGHVDVLYRGGLVGVHLLGELARDLDRLDAGAEGAAEDPLD